MYQYITYLTTIIQFGILAFFSFMLGTLTLSHKYLSSVLCKTISPCLGDKNLWEISMIF